MLNMKIAIVAIAKDEELYIEEWLNYYRKLGATHFFIFDNNDEGNNKLPELIGSNPDVSIIDIRGRKALNAAGMQVGCNTKIYNEQKDNFDYFGYFDIDEFLYMEGKTIEEFVSQEQFKNVDVIKFNWRYYGDNDLVWYDPRPVQERFPIPCPDDVKYALRPRENEWCKALLKSGKKMLRCLNHSFIMENGTCKHCSGKPGNAASMHEPIDFSGGYIKHYGTKTLEEYIKRKCLNIHQIFDNTTYSACQRLDWFFNVNKHTEEKDELAKFFYDRKI